MRIELEDNDATLENFIENTEVEARHNHRSAFIAFIILVGIFLGQTYLPAFITSPPAVGVLLAFIIWRLSFAIDASIRCCISRADLRILRIKLEQKVWDN